jgi:tetratricopeptide (TPR) repeat protein
MDKHDLFRTGQKLFIQGKHKESIKYFTKSIEAGAKTEITFLSRGVAFLKLQQTEKAIIDFTNVIELNGNNFRAYFYRGIANMANENFGEAIKDFDVAVKLQSDAGAAYFARGTAYAHIGNREEAGRNIKTAMNCPESALTRFESNNGRFYPGCNSTFFFEIDAPATYLTDKEKALVRKWFEDTYH